MIDFDLFKEQILSGFTIKELQEYWKCSRTKITDYKRKWNLIGLSPNNKKRDNGDGTKICNTCNIVKSLNDFYSSGYTNTGKQKIKGSCKICENTNRKFNYLQKIISILKDQNREYKCEICGYNKNSAALVFHHFTDIKNFEISNSKTVSEQILSEEIKLCQVLCQNCHHEVHNTDLNMIV